jgi:hypothetical protein
MSEVETPAETPEPVEIPKEIDWKAEARKWEDRAKENLSKAKANETAAQRLAEIEEANKTESERTAERLAAAERRAAELEAKATRAEGAAAKGVPASLLTGNTQEELEAAADALIAFRGEQKQTPKSDALSRVNQSPLSGKSSWSGVLQKLDAGRA